MRVRTFMALLLSLTTAAGVAPRPARAQTVRAEGRVKFAGGQSAQGVQVCVIREENKAKYLEARNAGLVNHTKKPGRVTYCITHGQVGSDDTLKIAGYLKKGHYLLYPYDTQKYEQRVPPTPYPADFFVAEQLSSSPTPIRPDPLELRVQVARHRPKGKRSRYAVVEARASRVQEKDRESAEGEDGCERHKGPQLALRGRLIDAAKMPLQGGAVSLSVANVGKEGFTVLGESVTGGEGSFKICFPKTEYNNNIYFTAAREGYEVFNGVLDLSKLEILPGGNEVALSPADEEDDSEREEAKESPLLAERFEATRRLSFLPEELEALPLSGTRSFDAFALLAAGVLPPPQTLGDSGPGVSQGVGTPGQFSINGLRSRENNFTIDGSDNNDEDVGTRRQGFVNLTPQPIESLQELQVVTALADARFGRNLGGQIDALTRSGERRPHGSLYGFYTSDKFNAKDFFDQTARGGPAGVTLSRAGDGLPVLLDGRPLTLPNPTGGENRYSRRQEGLTLGGPLPRLREAFFYTSAERVRVRADKESHFAVPTVAQRGLFGTGETGFLDFFRTFYPTTVPGDALFSLYPFPNNPSGPYGQNTYTSVLPANADGARFSAKLQKEFGEINPERKFNWRNFLLIAGGDSLSGRYNIAQERSTLPVTGGALFSSLRPWVRTQNVAFFLNRTLATNLSDTIRFSFGRTRLVFDEVRDPFLSPSGFFRQTPFLLNAPLLLNVTAPNADGTLNQTAYVSASSQQGAALLAAIGHPGVVSAEEVAGPLGQVVVPGFSPLGVDVNNFPQSRANNTFQIADTITYLRDRHLLTFGFDVRKTQINSTLDRGFRPLAVFNGLRTSRPDLNDGFQVRPGGAPLRQTPDYSGSTLAAAGLPTGLFQSLSTEPNSSIGIRLTQVGLFLQDEFRLRSNLRLTLGVRYELNTVPDTVGGRLEEAFDPAAFQANLNSALRDCQALAEKLSLSPVFCELTVRELNTAFPSDFKVTFGSDRNDFNARAGFAWDVLGDGKTILRGGGGSYTGQFNGFVIGQSRNAFPDFLPLNTAAASANLVANGFLGRNFLFNLANPLLRQALPTGVGIIVPGTLNRLPGVNPVSFLLNGIATLSFGGSSQPYLGLGPVQPQRRLTTPYSYQYGLTFEHQFGRSYLASLAYVGTRGVKLLRVTTPERGINRSSLVELGPFVDFAIHQFNPSLRFPQVLGTLLAPQQVSAGSKPLTVAPTLFESSASSTYNSLQAELRKRYGHGVQFGTALTYSHSIDNASDYMDTAGTFALPQNSLRMSERGSSSFDVRLRSVSNLTADLPRGWQLAGIITAQTGQPFTVNSIFDINRDGNLTDRLNRTDGLVVAESDGGRVQLGLAPGTSPSHLLAPDGSDGAVGRNTFRAPGLFTVDLALSNAVSINERQKLILRVEAFNLLNRTHFGIPVRLLEAPGFGSAVYTTVPARTIQFGLKLQF